MQSVLNPYQKSTFTNTLTFGKSDLNARRNFLNEISGNGNTIAFEFRNYDPRLGRWWSVDPLAARQPDQSPYKAFLNNPIIYTDPEGSTEFLTVIIKDEQSGAYVKMSVPISEQVMTDGKKHMVESMGCWHYENAYYDFSRVHKFTIKADGSVVHTGYTEILKDRGVKDWDYVWSDGAKWGDKQDEPSPFEMKGGLYMTGSGGQGTKYYSKNATDIGNVDDLIGALGGLTTKGVSNYNSNVTTLEVLEVVKRIKEMGDHWDNTVGKLQSALKDDDVGVQSSHKPLSNTTVWRTNEDGQYQGTTDWASPQEVQSGDTLGGKFPHKQSHPERNETQGTPRF
jgi:RHS repeat-associated protein